MNKYITTDWLNLRQEPFKLKGNVLAIMPPDSIVEQIASPGTNGWIKIKTIVGRNSLEGYAASSYLELTELELPINGEPEPLIPPVHLTLRGSKIIRRDSIDGRAYPLNEPGLLKINLKELGSPEARKAGLRNILDYLDVERKARYSPTTKNTFCNIYAYDVSYCTGAYLPRVWWNEYAIPKLKLNHKVEPIYDKTLRELNANSLTDWFEKYSTNYAWQRAWSINELQEIVNNGTLGVIVAQRINLNQSGHIVAVIPESSDKKAKREGGKVLSPLQSQAGRVNCKYFTNNNWWENESKFRKFGFYAFNFL